MKTLFFCLRIVCLPEKNRGRGSSPPMLKIWQNWGKIANYAPNAQQRFSPRPGPPGCELGAPWLLVRGSLVIINIIV